MTAKHKAFAKEIDSNCWASKLFITILFITILFMTMLFIAQCSKPATDDPSPVADTTSLHYWDHRSQYSTTGTKIRGYVVFETAHWNLLHYDAQRLPSNNAVSMKRPFEVNMVCLQGLWISMFCRHPFLLRPWHMRGTWARAHGPSLFGQLSKHSQSKYYLLRQTRVSLLSNDTLISCHKDTFV